MKLIILIFLIDLINIHYMTAASTASSKSFSTSTQATKPINNDDEEEDKFDFNIESNELVDSKRLVKKTELLACGVFHCNIIREFSIQTNFNCYSETLPIQFKTISQNGIKNIHNSYIPLMKLHDNKEDQHYTPYNLVRNSHTKQNSCIRIKKLVRFYI